MRADGSRRERGAYYTPPNLASFIAEWAIRSSSDRVLDPSAGLGSLVTAAACRAQAFGATGPPNVWGIELHRRTFERLEQRCAESRIPLSQLTKGDFFGTGHCLGKFDVILTNPPYVRHHDLPMGAAEKMRVALGAGGSAIDGKSSSWAYFVIRSMQLLRAGGRLAAIVPGELVSADYGRWIIEKVGEKFDRTVLVRCEGELFGDLQLTTIVILGEGYGNTHKRGGTVYGCSIDFDQEQPTLPSVRHMVPIRDARRSTAVLFSGARPADLQLVDGVVQAEGLRRLGEIASVAIGYVTGDTRFFHFTEAERTEASLRKIHFKRAVHRGAHVQGSIFHDEDWQATRDTGKQCWLFHPIDGNEESVKRMIARGLDRGVATRMKCRARVPWWRISLGKVPEAILVYLGKHPRIVENRAQAYAANSFFILTGLCAAVTSLAVASMTSVFQLSALTSARCLGGGLRKLQVRDAVELPIPAVDVSTGVCDEIDLLVRHGSWEEAVRLADKIVLKGELGWSDLQIEDWQSRLRRLSSAHRA